MNRRLRSLRHENKNIPYVGTRSITKSFFEYQKDYCNKEEAKRLRKKKKLKRLAQKYARKLQRKNR